MVLKYKPDLLIAKSSELFGVQRKGFWPFRVTVPLDGGSSAPIMYSKVLLPLPEGPMIETAEPGGNESETSETMRSGPAGVEYSFERFSTFSNRYSFLFCVRPSRLEFSLCAPSDELKLELYTNTPLESGNSR